MSDDGDYSEDSVGGEDDLGEPGYESKWKIKYKSFETIKLV